MGHHLNYLKTTVQRDASSIFIAGRQGNQIELLGERGSWRDGATFSSFQTCDEFRKLRVDHGDFGVLNHVHLNNFFYRYHRFFFLTEFRLLWCFSRISSSCCWSRSSPRLSRRDSIFPCPRWLPNWSFRGKTWILCWSTNSATVGLLSAERIVTECFCTRVFTLNRQNVKKKKKNTYLFDGQQDGGPRIAPVVFPVRHVSPDVIFYPQRFAGVVVTRLQRHRRRRIRRKVENERKSVGVTEFFHQFFLNRRQVRYFFRRRGDLIAGQHHFFAELYAHHLVFISTVPVSRGHLNRKNIPDMLII